MSTEILVALLPFARVREMLRSLRPPRSRSAGRHTIELVARVSKKLDVAGLEGSWSGGGTVSFAARRGKSRRHDCRARVSAGPAEHVLPARRWHHLRQRPLVKLPGRPRCGRSACGQILGSFTMCLSIRSPASSTLSLHGSSPDRTPDRRQRIWCLKPQPLNDANHSANFSHGRGSNASEAEAQR